MISHLQTHRSSAFLQVFSGGHSKALLHAQSIPCRSFQSQAFQEGHSLPGIPIPGIPIPGIPRSIQSQAFRRRAFQGRGNNFQEMPGPFNHVRWQVWCPDGSACERGFSNMGNFATKEEAIEKVIKHLMSSPKHSINEHVLDRASACQLCLAAGGLLFARSWNL